MSPKVSVIFIHGLAADRTVWWPVMDAADAMGPFISQSISLPGHGGEPSLSRPSFGAYASFVAERIDPEVEEIVVVGHSLGALVGAVIASGLFGLPVRGLVAIAPKLRWSEEEIAASSTRAARGRRHFPTMEEASLAARRLGGDGASEPGSVDRLKLLRGPSGGYASVFDPTASPTRLLGSAAGEVIRAAMTNVACPRRMIVGAHDAGVSIEELREYDEYAVELEGVGHNPHVEQPETVARLVRNFVDDVL